MAANVLFDSLNGMRDVSAKLLENDCVLVWIASTQSWVPRPYNDGSGDPGSVVIGNSVIGGYEFHVLYIDDLGKLNQLKTIPQNMVDDLKSDLSQKASKTSPYLSGEPKAAAPKLDDNSLRIATTGYVQGQAYEKVGNKGQAFGYPSLDATGRIPVEQLPTSVVEAFAHSTAEPTPRAGPSVVGAVPPSAREFRRGAGGRSATTIDPGIIRFSVSVVDKFAPKNSMFRGADHDNKLCYKDEHGIVHELYS